MGHTSVATAILGLLGTAFAAEYATIELGDCKIFDIGGGKLRSTCVDEKVAALEARILEMEDRFPKPSQPPPLPPPMSPPPPPPPPPAFVLSPAKATAHLNSILTACPANYRAYRVSGAGKETLFSTAIAAVGNSGGVLFLNAFAGPTPWNGGDGASGSGQIGWVDESLDFHACSDCTGDSSQWSGNANIQCGDSNPSYDPFAITLGESPDSYRWPTGSDGALSFTRSVLYCAGDGADTPYHVLCELDL